MQFIILSEIFIQRFLYKYGKKTLKAIKLGKISATKSEEAFTKTGFQNWKKALEKNSGLAKHNDSNSHKKASEDLMKASDYGTNDVCELLDDKLLQQQLKN